MTILNDMDEALHKARTYCNLGDEKFELHVSPQAMVVMCAEAAATWERAPGTDGSVHSICYYEGVPVHERGDEREWSLWRRCDGSRI